MEKTLPRRTLRRCCWIFFLLCEATSSTLKAQLPVAAPDCTNPCLDFRPSSGLGQFDVEIVGDVLRVELKVAYTWRNGNPELVRGFPPAEYEWKDAEKIQFEKELARRVGKAWSGAFDIASADGRRHMKVEVRVVTTPLDQAHWRIEVLRNPEDGPDLRASVCSPGSLHAGDSCELHEEHRSWGNLRLASSHLREEHLGGPEIPAFRIEFPWKEAVVPPLGGLTPAWLAGKPEWRILLTGFADRDEVEAPVERRAVTLARQRSTNLSVALQALACSEKSGAAHRLCTDEVESRLQVRNLGASGDDPDSSSSFVLFELFRTPAMDTFIHEAGHLLGLGDEAVTDGQAIGSPLDSAEYAALVAWYAGRVITRHDDDGIMSRGKAVRPWHYVPFLEALEVLTGTPGWLVVEPGEGEGAKAIYAAGLPPRRDRRTQKTQPLSGTKILCDIRPAAP